MPSRSAEPTTAASACPRSAVRCSCVERPKPSARGSDVRHRTESSSSIASPASPDLRIFAAGPLNQRYTALVEDITTGFVIGARAPTLILFDSPNGKVDATFFGGQDYPTFRLNMTLNGVVVATVVHGPNATIREP